MLNLSECWMSGSSPAKDRRHLRVIQNDRGQRSLALDGPIFEQPWTNQVASDAANVAFARLRDGVDVAQVLELTKDLLNECSRLTEKLASNARVHLECGAGCDHCCHEAVGVTAPEALQVYAYLRQTRSEEELNVLRLELRERSEAIRGLSTSERYSPDHPCPLLKDGSCSVYPARPFACRGMNSVDRADCESRLRDPVRRREFLRTGQGGRVLLDPLLATQAVSVGLQLALFEQFSLDMRQLDLIWALDLLFAGGADVAEAWAAGKANFESALGAAPR
ncbi:MAG TPA: YkgJ family cysteine cluster protein [Polyangiaceae bacterium]|nr:YkgJ family cysteine cluster protein [Polyangiaceae bacterium]